MGNEVGAMGTRHTIRLIPWNEQFGKSVEEGQREIEDGEGD